MACMHACRACDTDCVQAVELLLTLIHSRFSKDPLRFSVVFLEFSLWRNIVGTASGLSNLLNFMPNDSCRLAIGS